MPPKTKKTIESKPKPNKSESESIEQQPNEQDELLNSLIQSMLTLRKNQGKTKLFDEYNWKKKSYNQRRKIFRRLTDTAEPHKYSNQFISNQNKLLQSEQQQPIDVKKLPQEDFSNEFNQLIRLWRGDITTLQVDAIVNAANKSLVGCFIPLHSCIDSIIHAKAGVQLRYECSQLPNAYNGKTSCAEITKGYNLPAKHVIHTVGPVVHDSLTPIEMYELKECYLNCLNVAYDNGCESIAFCCISTGIFGFPNKEAAQIAIQTVNDWLEEKEMLVIFCVYGEKDEEIYSDLLCFGFEPIEIPSRTEYLKLVEKRKEEVSSVEDEYSEDDELTESQIERKQKKKEMKEKEKKVKKMKETSKNKKKEAKTSK